MVGSYDVNLEREGVSGVQLRRESGARGSEWGDFGCFGWGSRGSRGGSHRGSHGCLHGCMFMCAVTTTTAVPNDAATTAAPSHTAAIVPRHAADQSRGHGGVEWLLGVSVAILVTTRATALLATTATPSLA